MAELDIPQEPSEAVKVRAMRIEDRFVVAAPRERVWVAIKDPAIVAPCIPGCQGVEVVSPSCTRPKFAFRSVRSRPNSMSTSKSCRKRPWKRCGRRTRGEEGSRASSLSADNILRLTALSEQETEVWYSSEAVVVGRLGKFGFGIMKKKAESLGRDFAGAFKLRVEGPPAG